MAVAAQQAQPPQPLTIEKVKDNLYVIMGGGGNTAAYIIAKGVVLVDTKLANYGQPILDKVKSVTDKPITHIINTHTHGDHVGSNEFFPRGRRNRRAGEHGGQHGQDARVPGSGEETRARRQDVQGQADAARRKRVDRSLLLRPRAHQRRRVRGVSQPARDACRRRVLGTDTPIMDANNGGSGVDYPGTLAKARPASRTSTSSFRVTAPSPTGRPSSTTASS